jgi:hypothetical protein
MKEGEKVYLSEEDLRGTITFTEKLPRLRNGDKMTKEEHEFRLLEIAIERAILTVNSLQELHRSLTGKEYRPFI